MEIKKVYLEGQEETKGSNNPRYIIIHHPEIDRPCSITELNGIMRNMGYYMIGYNFYVRKNGEVYEGRPVSAEGANCYGYNTKSIGVCFEGDYDKETSMPQAQFNAGVELIRYLRDKYGIANNMIREPIPNNNSTWSGIGGHKMFSSTECPGRHFPLNKMLDCIENGQVTNIVKSQESVSNSDIKANARVVNDFLYARDSEGNEIGGYASIGDEIEVLDVSYSRQIDRIKYPTSNRSKERYVTNATNCIQYFYQDQWSNGSTPEDVYQDSELTQRIGSLSPWEKATPLYRENNHLHVVYSTDKGRNTKSGFVKYNGGFNKF